MARSLATLTGIVVALTLALSLLRVTTRRVIRCLRPPIGFLNRFHGCEVAASLPTHSTGNRVTLHVNGNEALPPILDALANARESIKWEVMLFTPDSIGQEIARALAQAARRGVEVQLLFDHRMSADGPFIDPHPTEVRRRYRESMRDMLTALREAGVAVLEGRPSIALPSTGLSHRAYETQLSITCSSYIPWNHYDHRKILVVDDRLAFIGGMNVGEKYLYRIAPNTSLDMVEEVNRRIHLNCAEAWPKWLDALVSIEGPAAASLARAFNTRWEIAGGTPLPLSHPPQHGGSSQVKVVFQRPGLAEIGNVHLELINSASSSIFIANPFVNYDPLLEALVSARERGVRVVLVSPSTHHPTPLAVRSLRKRSRKLLGAGVEYYENRTRMAHTKVLLVDDRWVSIGSFNLNHRSVNHDLEANVIIDDPSLASQVMERIFQPYIAGGARVSIPYRIPSNPLLDWLVEPFS